MKTGKSDRNRGAKKFAFIIDVELVTKSNMEWWWWVAVDMNRKISL